MPAEAGTPNLWPTPGFAVGKVVDIPTGEVRIGVLKRFVAVFKLDVAVAEEPVVAVEMFAVVRNVSASI